MAGTIYCVLGDFPSLGCWAAQNGHILLPIFISQQVHYPTSPRTKPETVSNFCTQLMSPGLLMVVTLVWP